MSNFMVGLILTSAAFFFTACNTSSSSNKVPVQENATCVPESVLAGSDITGIVGGQRVTQNDTDSKAVVMLNTVLDKKLGICTASLIAPDVLLTAGHCISGTADKTFVTLYTSLSCESGFDSRHNTVRVSELIVNEKFDSQLSERSPSQMEGDVALVILNEPLPPSYPVYKIADPALVSKSEPLYFYGYGSTRYDEHHPAGAGILRKTQLPGRAVLEINSATKKVTVDQTEGTGLCTGDSGGPGLVQINGELQILGINSYIQGSTESAMCSGKATLVLANSYKDWIETKLRARGRRLGP